jgi:hypothetical protein
MQSENFASKGCPRQARALRDGAPAPCRKAPALCHRALALCRRRLCRPITGFVTINPERIAVRHARLAFSRQFVEDASMTASASVFLGVASLFSWGIGLAVLVAFIIAIATVVRRHRPDALPILFGAVIFEILITLCSFVATIVLPRFATPALGMAGYAETQAINTVVFAVAHAAARSLLLWGVIRLAQPAPAMG